MHGARNEFVDIPVLLDSFGDEGGVPLARCVYFQIEVEDTLDPWTLTLGSDRFPFYMLGLAGIIHAPSFNESRFSTQTQITTFFELIEERDGRFVETADLWIPADLLPTSCRRNDVLRVGQKLFSLAMSFRQGTIDLRSYFTQAKEMDSEMAKSPEETRAFEHWAKVQFDGNHAWINHDEPPLRKEGGEDMGGGFEPPPPSPQPPLRPLMH
ncbi:MAG: hypothetical protein ACFUZC_16345 [Chthoniobacteraceae bacterium]